MTLHKDHVAKLIAGTRYEPFDAMQELVAVRDALEYLAGVADELMKIAELHQAALQAQAIVNKLEK